MWVVKVIAMSFNLSGKKILVTGASRGIGRELAKTLSEHGCTVYALARTKDALETLASECSNIIPIEADISNWDELRYKLKDLEPLDGFVNNAAISGGAPQSAVDMGKEFLETRLNTNLVGPINLIQIIAKKMIEAKKPGSIVNVSSVWSLQAVPGYMAYTVTKAAIDMVTKQFALELGPHNIRVNSVNPTLVLTDSFKEYLATGAQLDKTFINKTPLGRGAEVSEVIAPILYLLSDCSSMVSGTVHIIDGGMTSTFSKTLA